MIKRALFTLLCFCLVCNGFFPAHNRKTHQLSKFQAILLWSQWQMYFSKLLGWRYKAENVFASLISTRLTRYDIQIIVDTEFFFFFFFFFCDSQEIKLTYWSWHATRHVIYVYEAGKCAQLVNYTCLKRRKYKVIR